MNQYLDAMMQKNRCKKKVNASLEDELPLLPLLRRRRKRRLNSVENAAGLLPLIN